jgi:hypothetical protein
MWRKTSVAAVRMRHAHSATFVLASWGPCVWAGSLLVGGQLNQLFRECVVLGSTDGGRRNHTWVLTIGKGVLFTSFSNLGKPCKTWRKTSSAAVRVRHEHSDTFVLASWRPCVWAGSVLIGGQLYQLIRECVVLWSTENESHRDFLYWYK